MKIVQEDGIDIILLFLALHTIKQWILYVKAKKEASEMLREVGRLARGLRT